MDETDALGGTRHPDPPQGRRDFDDHPNNTGPAEETDRANPAMNGHLDSRRVMSYLLAGESDDYIAVMDVLEASVTDMTPAEVTHALTASGYPLPVPVVETRLDKLREWGAVSARTDSTRILRYADLLARNWRYTASPTGRQVQRFYRTVLAATPTVREIPLVSLNRIVTTLERLADSLASLVPSGGAITDQVIDDVGSVFTSHDDLDAALVGAEDALASLADRFDLDDVHTRELKGLLVDYATRVAAELDTGAARAARALARLEPWFNPLAEAAVSSSQARALIEAGALTASRGGRREDWDGLTAWFDPYAGRAARFSLRLVRCLPGMHANLRRLHSSVGTASSRSRALALAKAVFTPGIGTQIFQAATGDHSWRKLYDESDDDESVRNPSWRGGPQVTVPPMLRRHGRAGPRGRGGASRDDTAARAEVAAARAARQKAHAAAIAVILATDPGQPLTDRAARVALFALMAATRSPARGTRRSATRDGLACTLVNLGPGHVGTLLAPTWSVRLPGRVPLFHLPGQRPAQRALAVLTGTPQPDADTHVDIRIAAAPKSVRRDGTGNPDPMDVAPGAKEEPTKEAGAA